MINMLFSLYNFHESWARDIVTKYINSNDKVLIIPFSFGDKIGNNKEWQDSYSKGNGKCYESIVAPFVNYGIKEKNINWINYFEDTKKNAKVKIKDSNIIFFTDGLPDKMMSRLMEFDLIDIIESFTGIIIGSSAGAMVQIAEYHITPDKDYNSFTYNLGLSMINNFDIEVHYEGTEVQNKYIKKVFWEKKDKIYAITNNGGMVVDNGKIILLGDTQTFSKQ
ncbi:Type 1 glutamine amidotransferase-like domain-containing protein [Clostridium sporogenes]|uniref:Peptidase S51 n=1 Tax=Clostridium botulinum TaxID=1491 RepID=A0A6M0T2P5_CLOBO|nr:Type 1 glutamine amidotransferase-like domain-containing protein [Clostridium sporogenes]NFA61230.1 peptidase S51 [Clostridium botulinum]NFI72062.1 peptidase S51 [Clostridium sporogenes]NFL72759.1 peptidase S51 [Clostridium sporogenes]NFM24433.1 peptidase S51 [Clostridium sporogenes]NFP61090.1 peptidase S51 [Clostridium sporogenes]